VGTLASILAVISLSAFLGGILGLALWAFWFFASREGGRESGADDGVKERSAEEMPPDLAASEEGKLSRHGRAGNMPSGVSGSRPDSAAAHPVFPQTHTDLLYSEGGRKAVSAIRFYAVHLDETVREGGRSQAANAWSAFMHLQVWMKVLEARTKMGQVKKETPR
jgi:hypothetical protein